MSTCSTTAAVSATAELSAFLVLAHSQNYSGDNRNKNYQHYYCPDIFGEPYDHYKHLISLLFCTDSELFSRLIGLSKHVNHKNDKSNRYDK